MPSPMMKPTLAATATRNSAAFMVPMTRFGAMRPLATHEAQAW